jgi:hypothetical protein
MQHQLLGKGTASLENKEIVSLSSQIAITWPDVCFERNSTLCRLWNYFLLWPILQQCLYLECTVSNGKPEGHRIESWWGGFFQLTNPSTHTMALGSTQRLTEMSTRNLPGDKGRLARKTDNLTAICESTV